MSRLTAPFVALASCVWKLVSAWWNVDRIRVPHSRRTDCENDCVDDHFQQVNAARVNRASCAGRKSNP